MQFIERKAHQLQIRYVYIGQNNVGIISNSAGMAMASVDALE